MYSSQQCASAAKAKVGGIKDDTILMSTTTFNNTLNEISNRQTATGGTVNTRIVNNQVEIMDVTPPAVVPQKSTTTPNTNANQGTDIGSHVMNSFNVLPDSTIHQIRYMTDDEYKKEVDNRFLQEYRTDWVREGQKYILTGEFLSGNESAHPYDSKNQLEYTQGKIQAVVGVVGTAVYAGVGLSAAIPAIAGSASSASTIAGGSAVVSASPKIAEQAQKVLNQPVLRNASTGRFMSNTVYQMNKLMNNLVSTTKDITQETLFTKAMMERYELLKASAEAESLADAIELILKELNK